MNLDIDGRIALVTGGDSGIGWHAAQALLGEGARVAITGRTADKLAQAAEDLGGEVVAVQADVTDPGAVQRMVAEVTQRLGAPDILVHSAGVTGARGKFHEIDDDGWRATIETNLLATARVVRAVLEPMCSSTRCRRRSSIPR